MKTNVLEVEITPFKVRKRAFWNNYAILYAVKLFQEIKNVNHLFTASFAIHFRVQIWNLLTARNLHVNQYTLKYHFWKLIILTWIKEISKVWFTQVNFIIKDPNKSNTQKYFRHSNVKRYELALLRSGYFIYFGRLYLWR